MLDTVSNFIDDRLKLRKRSLSIFQQKEKLEDIKPHLVVGFFLTLFEIALRIPRGLARVVY